MMKFMLAALVASARSLAPAETRRHVLRRHVLGAPVAFVGLASTSANAAASTKKDAELVLEKLKPIPGLIDEAKWDSVRTVLKTHSPGVERDRHGVGRETRPDAAARARSNARRARRSPVAELWNLGASKNWLRSEALAAGDPDLIELSEDLSSALQLTDQYVYDNNVSPRRARRRRSPSPRSPLAVHLLPAGQRQAQDEGAQGPGADRAEQAEADHRRPLGRPKIPSRFASLSATHRARGESPPGSRGTQASSVLPLLAIPSGDRRLLPQETGGPHHSNELSCGRHASG